MGLKYFLYFLVLVVRSCEPSNILIMSTAKSHSHSLWCTKLAELLAVRGHQVTIVDTDPPRKNVPNVTTYVLENLGDIPFENYNYDEMSLKVSPSHSTDLIFEYATETCIAGFNSPSFKKFVEDYSKKTKPFDLIIQDMTICEIFLGLVPHFGNPKLISVSAFGEPTNVLYVMKNQQNFIHSPLHLSPYAHPMTFTEKMKNLFYTLHYHYKFLKCLNKLDIQSKEFFGSNTPHLLDIARTSKLALVNSHPLIDEGKYYSPEVIPIGGFHVEDAKKLDEKTQAFLDEAEDGVILFSLGSNFPSSLMTKERINMFLNVFKTLKQRVLWKFEDNLPNIPENVMISKWLPQNDILGHPNVKLFIYHMGLLGTQEAIYHGVPILGMPLVVDQHYLVHRLSKKGIARKLTYVSLSEDIIRSTIQEMLTNQSYTNEMKRWSKIFKDRPLNPRDLAVYWIEFVLRNDDLDFLKPPEAHLGTLELFILDLKTLVCILVGLIIIVVCKCFCFKKCKKTQKLKRN